ncbi:MAG: DUF599 domain-containing protein [Alphaproteobacteria bacterium]|nr:DUF599 domain-containing protein [Alphaproteobacteria bacterium]
MTAYLTIDVIAILVFLLCWAGYTVFSDRHGTDGNNLIGTMARQREAWMRQMLRRDNRMVDIQIIRNLTRTGVFFASTTILILAGLVTILGATDQAIGLVANVPLVSELSPLEWEMRLIGLILIFVYAFFKFAWSIRQLSYCAIQIGAMEPAGEADDACAERCILIAKLSTLAGRHFNRGLRGYYFATALLAWFIHPFALIVAAVWVVLVLYRREFHSRTLDILRSSQPNA